MQIFPDVHNSDPESPNFGWLKLIMEIHKCRFMGKHEKIKSKVVLNIDGEWTLKFQQQNILFEKISCEYVLL